MLLFLLLSVTACLCQPYCSSGSGPTSTADSNLGATSLYGESLSFTDTTDCPGYIGPRDLTNLQADVVPGGTYILSYTVTTCGKTFRTLSGAWIDWNNDHQWTDDEKLGAFSTAKNLVNLTFTVPLSALAGWTRMRVQVQESEGTTLNPCYIFPYGGTKDFSILVGQVAKYCDAGPTTSVDSNLALVQLFGDAGGIDVAISCPGPIGPQRSTQTTSLVRGRTYSVKLNITSCSNNHFNTLTGLWIDVDHSGQYLDKDLLASTTSQGLVNLSFTVPNGSYYGNTSLRVQTQETNSINLNPCAIFPYGGTQDFWINLTDASSTYCLSGPASLEDTALGPVKLNGETQQIVNEDGCPGVVGPQDLTSQIADLMIGVAYTLEYDVLNCSHNKFPVVSAAWIDFNQNLKFEGWEQIAPYSNTFGSRSVLFKVPVSTPGQTVQAGRTRIRVQVQEKADAPLDACAQFAYGGTKDFSVLIKVNADLEEMV